MEKGGRRRQGLLMWAEGVGEVGRWGTTPLLASHTSDLTGPLLHTPTHIETRGQRSRETSQQDKMSSGRETSRTKTWKINKFQKKHTASLYSTS